MDAPDKDARGMPKLKLMPKPKPGVDVPDKDVAKFVVQPKPWPTLSPRPPPSHGADVPDKDARERLLPRPKPTLRHGADAPDKDAARRREMLTLWLMLPIWPLSNCKRLAIIAFDKIAPGLHGSLLTDPRLVTC